MRLNKPNKSTKRGQKVLTQEQLMAINEMHWERGLSDHGITKATGHSGALIARSLAVTWADYLKMKEMYENNK
jgi:hypothetical protein